MPTPLLLGIDVGGTQTRVAVARTPRSTIHRQAFGTPRGADPEVLVDRIEHAARQVVNDTGDATIIAGVAAAAGTVDSRSGIIVESPNLPMVRDLALAQALSDRLGCPMAVENDATAAALAVHRIGLGRGTREMVYLTISTGIGGGIISSGRLVRGVSGAAGEFGHMTVESNGIACACGRRGCWETLASGTAIAREARELLRGGNASSLRDMVGTDEIDRVTARHVFRAAREGDALCTGVIDRAVHALGIGLANVVNILNPELIVLGGGIARSQHEFVARGVEVAKQRAFGLHTRAVRFAITGMGDDSGLRGALILARELATSTANTNRDEM